MEIIGRATSKKGKILVITRLDVVRSLVVYVIVSPSGGNFACTENAQGFV